MTFARTALVNDFRQSKGEYMREDDPERKRQLRQRVDNLRAEIALELKHKSPGLSEGQMQKKRKEISILEKSIESARNASIKTELQRQAEKLRRALAAHESASAESDTGFDWAVEFAEVFMPTASATWRMDGLHPLLNDFKAQGTLVEEADADADSGGFDIVLANPPYVRHELLGREYKERMLKPVFSEVYASAADLYVYFYGRAAQILREGGVGVFISSSKWLRAGYGEKLRQELLDKQAFHLVVDFGELPVFGAATFPAIFLWQKQSRDKSPTMWSVIKDLQACYEEGIRAHVTRSSQVLPASQFGVGQARLVNAFSADRRAKMEAAGPRITELIKNQIYFGIKTGLNEAFIVDQTTYDRLIDEDDNSKEILKPLLAGDDVRHYESHFRGAYLIWTYIGVPIKRYPAVLRHLTRFQAKAKRRSDQGHKWWELRACDYYEIFDRPKIIYPQMMKEPRFKIDKDGYYPNKTIFTIPSGDWFLLGVLNSQPMWEYLKLICSAFGDPEKGGRLETYGLFMETLPIPDAPTVERSRVARLAEQTQDLHTKRRKRVDRFLRDLGTTPAESGSRNPLEQPWAMTPDVFTRRSRNQSLKKFTDARDETHALTEQIIKIEREIDERVAALYGVPLDPNDQKTIVTGVDPEAPFA
jgi:hypothetical protein